MELLTLGLFCTVLISCIVGHFPLLAALAVGLVIFLAYGFLKDFGLSSLAKMCWESILTIRNILITFFLIGMLTAIWRACGTIPVIITLASGFISPGSFVMTTFLLNALVSFLIGTSFGTVATMGVICISIAHSLQLDSFWVSGAIISGIYFGDRCSPVSTSALLVSTLTETDLYKNLKLMLKTCLLPTLAVCGIYYYVGSKTAAVTSTVDVRSLFSTCFNLELWCVLPAVIILLLALIRVQVKLTMGASIAAALVIAAVFQNTSVMDMGKLLVFGYEAPSVQLGKLLNGGGIISMLKPVAIVGIASCYSGIFQGTGLLDNIQKKVLGLADSKGNFFTVLLTSIVMGMIACNQTLNIMLTNQLCKEMTWEKEQLALALEDTAVLVSPAIPWNLAVAVPLATIGAEDNCILAACYLYAVPLFRLLFLRDYPKQQFK